MTGLQIRIVALFRQNEGLEELQTICRSDPQTFWLVGGCLRDLILGRPLADIDIVASTDPTDCAITWAKQTSGRWFWLDEQRRQSRVLMSDGKIVDFCPLRAPTIEEDQRLRDFTVNSLAVSLDSPLEQQPLLDPLQACRDIENKLLRCCSPQSFVDDPLRMLKGVRHAVAYDFHFSTETLALMNEHAAAITAVAAERIRDELCIILGARQAVRGLRLLNDTGLLAGLFGPPGEGWGKDHAFAELEMLNSAILALEHGVDETETDPGKKDCMSHRISFLLARLLAEYRPTDLRHLLREGLRLSRYQQQLVETLQQPLPENFTDFLGCLSTPRRKALWYESLEPFALDRLLYHGVCPGRLRLHQALDLHVAFQRCQTHGRVPDLLAAPEISGRYPQCFGKCLGDWLSRIKHAEINGEIVSKNDALKWLESENSD